MYENMRWCAICLGLASAIARAADSDPDPGFSGDGKVFAQWATPALGAHVALAPSSSIHVGATARGTASGDNFAVAKFTNSGSLVTGFGFLGYRTVDFSVAGSPASDDQLLGVFPTANDGVLLAGSSNLDGGFSQYPALALLRSDGDPDDAIGAGGRRDYRNAAWPQATLITSAVARQADGKLVFAGTCRACPDASVGKVFALRVGADGTPDPTFGNDGWALLQRGETLPRSVTTMTVDTAGRIVVGGVLDTSGSTFAFLARLLPDGEADAGFAGSWSIVNPQPAIASGNWKPTALVANPDGTLVVAMNWWHSTERNRSVLIRRTASGMLDYSFNGGFRELTRDAGSEITALARLGDGRIVAVGSVTSAASQTDFFVARVHADGALDDAFDNNGVARIPMHADGSRADAVTLDAGRPLIAGSMLAVDPRHVGVLRLSSDRIFSNYFE